MSRSRATPLQLACSNGHADTVDVLLRAGADPNFVNDTGHTALSLSLLCAHELPGYKELIHVLYDANADLSTTNNRGETLMHLLVRYNRTPEVLLDLGMPVDVPHKITHESALLWACTRCADPSQPPIYGTTLRALLKHGALPNGPNSAGLAPFQVVVASFQKFYPEVDISVDKSATATRQPTTPTVGGTKRTVHNGGVVADGSDLLVRERAFERRILPLLRELVRTVHCLRLLRYTAFCLIVTPLPF